MLSAARRALGAPRPAGAWRAASRQLSGRIEPRSPLDWSPAALALERRSKTLRTKQKGIDIIHDPIWNKGMGFSYAERDRLNLRGLLPPRVKDLEMQLARVMKIVREEGDGTEAALRKNLHLQARGPCDSA